MLRLSLGSARSLHFISEVGGVGLLRLCFGCLNGFGLCFNLSLGFRLNFGFNLSLNFRLCGFLLSFYRLILNRLFSGFSFCFRFLLILILRLFGRLLCRLLSSSMNYGILLFLLSKLVRFRLCVFDRLFLNRLFSGFFGLRLILLRLCGFCTLLCLSILCRLLTVLSGFCAVLCSYINCGLCLLFGCARAAAVCEGPGRNR